MFVVEVDGVHYGVLQDMKFTFRDFYKSLFTEPKEWRPNFFDGLFLPLLWDSDRRM